MRLNRRRRNSDTSYLSVDWRSPVNWDHPLNNGLEAWLLAVPTSAGGTVFRDLARKAEYTLTNMEEADWTVAGMERRGGWAGLTFGGTDEFLLKAGSPPVSGYPVSLTCLFNSNNITGTYSLVNVTNAAGSSYVSLAIDGNNEYGFSDSVVADPSQAGRETGTSTDYVAGTWHHAAGVYESTTSRSAYLDAAGKGTSTVAGSAPSGWANVSIGAFRATSPAGTFGPLIGRMDDIRIYSRTLNDVEVAELYRQSFSYNPHLLNRRARVSYFVPTAAITVTPPTASLTLTGFAPTVSAPRLATPTTASLVLSTFAPTVIHGTVVTPTTAALSLETFAPTVSTPRLVTPDTAALTLTGFAPTVSAPRLVTPTTAELALTTFAPSVVHGTVVTPTTASLELATFAPTVSTPRLATPTTAELTLTGFAPTVTAGGDLAATPETATLTLTGFAPTVSAPRLVTPDVATLTITGFAPTVATPRLVTPATAELTISAFSPTVTVATGSVTATPSAVALVLTTFAPDVSTGVYGASWPRRAAPPRAAEPDKPHRRSVKILPWPLAARWAILQPTVTAGASVDAAPLRTRSRLLDADATGASAVEVEPLWYSDFKLRKMCMSMQDALDLRQRILIEDQHYFGV